MPLQRSTVEVTQSVSHKQSQQHTVEQIVDVPVLQVVVFEHIVKQIVDVLVTIPQERVSERTLEPNRAEFRSLLDTLFPGTSGSSSSAPASDSVPQTADLLEKTWQRIKRRQEVETALNALLKSSYRKKSSRQYRPLRRPRRANTSADVDGVRHGNRLPGAV